MTLPRIAFEDFSPGNVAEYGDMVVDRDEMVAFAREYDPQPMHLSDEAAAAAMLGGLIGSGWYSTALLMRMNCDAFLLDASSLGSPGVDKVEWLAPVRAGDRLSVRREVLDARASKSRPDMGIVRFRFELRNQTGAVVMRQEGPILFGRREPEAA
jgi:acyl dehydratase